MIRGAPKAPLPWDIVVFVTITTVGFGFSVRQLAGGSPGAHFYRPNVTIENIQMDLKEDRSLASEGLITNSALDLGCLERQFRKQKIETTEGAIRIKGRICNLSRVQMKEFGGVSVKNVTTGQESTIYFQGLDNAFMTDYLAVHSGKNVIRVEWRNSEKTASNHLTAEIVSR